MGRYRWVLLDLFDTLCTVDEPVYYEGKRKTAELVGVELEVFLSAWTATSHDASVGRLKTPFDRAMQALDALGIDDRALAARVAQLDVETIQQSVFYYEGAREALQTLRARGFHLGLLSNATATTAFAISPLGLRHDLDLLVFSYEVGLVKPDPAIYHLALKRADSPPARCLFVGDGANGELDAAAKLGLGVLCMDHPVKALSFRNADTLSRPDHAAVRSFKELLDHPDLQGPQADD